MFKKYRIYRIGHQQYIPQYRENIIFGWDGIASSGDGKYVLWYSPELQVKYCSCHTIEEALRVIQTHSEVSGKYDYLRK